MEGEDPELIAFRIIQNNNVTFTALGFYEQVVLVTHKMSQEIFRVPTRQALAFPFYR